MTMTKSDFFVLYLLHLSYPVSNIFQTKDIQTLKDKQWQ